MHARRKFCVMTGTRAEYGLLYWLMHDLAAAEDMDLQIVASAMHLAPEFGMTVDLIRRDGFEIDAEVPCLTGGDDNIALGKSIGVAHLGFVDAFARLKPDMLLLLGDRFETLAAATAATALRIPIAHMHGGEASEGAMDDVFRHAVTKMSHLHFVAAELYARRVIQMGEEPWRVTNVGALGLENFVRTPLPDRADLEAHIGIRPAERYVLLTWHPETLTDASPVAALDEILAALDELPGHRVLATKANADPGGRAINARLLGYAAAHPNRIVLADSLGQARYLAAMRDADAVIGNSSSGIIEAPAVDVPTVNIGSRQDGRLRAQSVIDCIADRRAIAGAIRTAMAPAFRQSLGAMAPPYGRPRRVADAIIERLRDADIGTLLRKSFHDVEFSDGLS